MFQFGYVIKFPLEQYSQQNYKIEKAALIFEAFYYIFSIQKH